LIRNAARTILSLLAMISTVVFTGNAQNTLTHHVRQATRDGSAPMVGHLSSSQTMRLVLTLPLRNEDRLDSLLEDLYNPNSPNFRQFLSVEEFTERFGPTQEDYDLALDFARTHGLKVVGTSINRLNIDVVGSVANIENALHIKMNSYKHPEEGRNFYGPDREPTVDLPFSLWHISGLDNFSIPRPAGLHKRTGSQPAATTGSGPSASFLGSDMRTAYYGGTTLTGSGQSVALLEYVGIDLADVNTYYANAHQTNSVPITVKSTDGTSEDCFASSGCDDTEQVLDVTQALGMAPGLSSLIVYVGSTDVSILNAMANDDTSAQIGCSWAWRPADPATDDPYFKQMGAQGQNFFVAAGDSGKWPTRRSPYYFPADDAYTTSVGGTSLKTSGAGGAWSSESAWSYGGGGITPDSIAIPSWQVATANGCASCSKSLRNAPDVSANADYSFYVCANQTTCTANLYGGTSFAAPMWAGYLALVNQQKGGRVGFINPALYAIGNSSSFNTDFHDITSGSNGYSAVTGYDLATGWGSPHSGATLISDIIAGGPGGGGTTDFTISVSAASLSVSRGSSSTDTITIADSGGNSTVSLSASGQGKGVSITFSPSSLGTSGTSVMKVNANHNAATGTFTITVTGKSASATHTKTVTLTVQ
jgi:subtilase family serine protease